MSRIREHPSAASRSRAPTARNAKPPACGPDNDTKGPREIVKQAARDIEAGIVDDDRRRIPDDVPGPRENPEHQRQNYAG